MSTRPPTERPVPYPLERATAAHPSGGGNRPPAPTITPSVDAATGPPPTPAPAPLRGLDAQVGASEETRQRVKAAVAFHIGTKLPGIEWSNAVDPLADRFLEQFGSDPAMVSSLEEDVNTLFALSDEDIVMRIARGEPLGQFGDVFDAIAEVSWEVGATDLATRLEAERADSISGTFDALTHAESLTFGADGTPIKVNPTTRYTPDLMKAQTFETLFDVPGAWSYSPSSGILAVTVGDETIGVEARPGFDPTSHLDVMAEVVAAQADGRVVGGALTPQHDSAVETILNKAHEVGAWVESHPFARESVDRLWGAFEVLGGPLAPNIDEARDQLRDDKGQINETAVRLASVIPFPDDAMVASLAREWMRESDGGLTSKDALALAADAVVENRDQLVADFESMTQEQLLSELESDIEGQSPIGRALETSLGGVVDVLEFWDQLCQQIGVSYIDTYRDLFGALATGLDEGIGEGFEHLKKVAELPEWGTTAGEYFGLTGWKADVANLTVSGIFDPLNYVLPGAKGLRAMARRALTNPKYAGVYLRMGAFPTVAKEIAGATLRKTVEEELPHIALTRIPGRLTAEEVARGEVAEQVGETVAETVATRSGEVITHQQARAVRSVMSMSGLGDQHYQDLLRLVFNPDSTVGDVNAVWTRALADDWLGEGPMRALRHSTVEGMGSALEAIAGGHLSPEHMDTVMKMTAKLAVGRTFRLGENQALDNIADLIVQFYPHDPEKASKWFFEAVQRRAAAADETALAGVNAMTKESARRAMTESGGTIKAVRGGDDIRGINQNIRAIDDALTHIDDLGLDEAGAAQVRDELTRMRAAMTKRADDAAPKLAAAAEKQKVARQQLKQATYLEADAANTSRNEMAAVVAEFYDEIATELNTEFGREVIPVVKGKQNPFAPHVPVRDWSEITGVKKFIAGDDPDLALMMGLSVDNVDMARNVDAIGMFNRSQKMLLPASPYEVLLFQKLGKDKGLLSQATRVLRNEYLKKISSGIKVLFAANLLVNPLTAGKITLDETLRFLADTGEVGKFLRATIAGVPGVGKLSEGAFQRIAAKYGDATVNPYGLAHKRNVGGWSSDDFADYAWVHRPPRRVGPGQMSRSDYAETVERWVNGTLLNDRRFQQYAKWVNEADILEDGTRLAPREFVEWWDDGVGGTRPGKAEARGTTVRIRDEVVLGTDLTAQDAFKIIDDVFEHWLNLVVDESARPLMRRRLLEGASTPGRQLDLTKDARLLKAVSQVPGLSGQTGIGSQIFNLFFGAPSGRRAGVFYDHYFDEAFNILLQRHGDRVLTGEKVMEFAGVDKETAEFWLKQGADNATVSHLMRETGARTEAQLAAKAAQYAERRSDDLMYRFTSASMVGRGVEAGLLFPFARAQVDFLSWWADHLTKPMTLRIPIEARARMPEAVRKVVEGVERLPVNLRALSKYSHLVAAVNNDQPSWIDQTIDNMTFFPMHFDSNFLIDVSPQFGPVPSWIFDIMVDKGWIDEDMNANLEALFPALGYTEYEGDFAGDLFNRLLPTSRRSLRDLTAGMLRSGYGLVGEDIHTNPGVMGQIANIIADGKMPAATGDFQSALVADYLKENIWLTPPGSEEFDQGILRVAVSGAAEANREEWGQDMMDRVFPLSGYDAEYRALRAFDGLFDDSTFQEMAGAGLFQSNDLLDRDGTPRIKEVWDRYVDGKATQAEMAWLDDRLHSAYFDAGRLEVLPGFSYLDYLNLTNPEIAVNLVNKSEDSGIRVRSDEHAAFKQTYINKLTGRLQNVPPGDEGRELISDARRRGWLVSRPVEEWGQDAAEAVYKSGSRALRGVWETVSHRTWQQGLKKSIEDKAFTLGEREARILQAAGMSVETNTTYTYKDFHSLLDDFDERFHIAQPTLINTLENGAVHGQLAKHNDEYGLGLIQGLHEADLEFNKLGYESVEDWPESSKAEVRKRFGEAITLGYTTTEDYRQEIEPIFGPLNYEPPIPPPVADIEQGIRLTGDELNDVDVVDGDTIAVWLADGPMRVRVIGINSPEASQPGYGEARDMLAKVISEADEVVVGIYKPELFGLTQLSAPGEHRLLAWLYVDGVPLYDPTVFTASNPRGAGVGGKVVDLEAIMAKGVE